VDQQMIVLLDVGADGGLNYKWLPHLEKITPVFVEPSSKGAERLRQMYPGATIIDVGLSNRNGKFPLYITRGHGCTSLRLVNEAVTRRYKVRPVFDVISQTLVQCQRYDDLFSKGVAPAPHIIKVDVQGMEYEVLEGMGGLLENVSAIELEAHFYPIYTGQKLIGDVVTFLGERGLYLRKIEPQLSFDSDLVEVNAFFTRPTPGPALTLAEQVWNLTTSPDGEALAQAVLRDTPISAFPTISPALL
jgi:FkbM family methyltransferase